LRAAEPPSSSVNDILAALDGIRKSCQPLRDNQRLDDHFFSSLIGLRQQPGILMAVANRSAIASKAGSLSG
jgi:hypothetical protein